MKKDIEDAFLEYRKEIIAAFTLSSKVIRKLRTDISKKLEKEDLETKEIVALVEGVDKLLSLSMNVPAKLKLLAEVDVITGKGIADKGRGGADIGDSQEPESTL